MDYLQVWFQDVEYAAGWGKCPRKDLMTNPPTACSKYTPPASMPTVVISPTEGPMNAQGLLAAADANIPTASPAPLPRFGYDNGGNQPCGCQAGYEQRSAFDGDDVCVTAADKAAAANENSTYAKKYSVNETLSVPYGVCKTDYYWRQASMGDCVCVTKGQADTVAADNVAGATHAACPPAP